MLPVGGIIAAAWSRDRIEHLAYRDPEALHRAMGSGALSPARLAHAAEEIGRMPSGRALEVLRSLLRHTSPLVREGAVYGLSYYHGHDANPTVLADLRALAEGDPSPGVRAAAAEALGDLEAP